MITWYLQHGKFYGCQKDKQDVLFTFQSDRILFILPFLKSHSAGHQRDWRALCLSCADGRIIYCFPSRCALFPNLAEYRN
jgi:hypothetical protein